MVEFMKVFLPVYALLFFFVVFLLRTFIVWKRTGTNAYVMLSQGGAHGVIGRYFKLMPFASLFVIGSFSFYPSLYGYLAPILWLETDLIILTGLLLLIVSLFWVWAAQSQMGNSWRIGIDEKSKTELVTEGIFTISRNPIFLGIKITNLGFFLVLPNAVTLSILILGAALIDIQVALEEKYLTGIHGENYRRYCEKVRRWI